LDVHDWHHVLVTSDLYDSAVDRIRQIVLEQPAACFVCDQHLAVGDLAQVNDDTQQYRCAPCAARNDFVEEIEEIGAIDQPVRFGTPGGAAQREYERRRAKDRQTARRELPVRIALIAFVMIVAGVFGNHLHHGDGGLFAVLAGLVGLAYFMQRRQSTEAWGTGAKGERAVGARIAKIESKGVVAIHDRRIPGSRANIDHIAVAPTGVYVIDTKVVSGKVVVKTTGPIWNRGPVRLFIKGRDKSSFIENMDRQVEAVARVLQETPWAMGVGIHPMVVLVGAEVGFFARPWRIRGVWVGWPREMQRVLSKSGSLSPQQVVELSHVLASRLPDA
jgi:hypothetical protein